MVNRNAARHLLFVVSILLCFFIYMGYRLFRGGEETAAPPAETAAEFASSSGSPAPGSLRPGGAGLRPSPPPESVPLDDWASSGGDDFPELAAAPGSVIPAPPGGGIPFEDAASSSSGVAAGLPFDDIASSSSSSGPVAGMIPAPPSDAAPAGMRPPGAGYAGSTDDAAAVLSPPPFFASGSSPASSGDEAVFSEGEAVSPPSSLPIPPFGGSGASSPADDAAAVTARSAATEFVAAGAAPPQYETSSYASSDAGDDAYQDAVDEPPPFSGPSAATPSGPVMRPPGSASRPAPAPAAAVPESRPAAPPPPVRSYDDGGYDEYGNYDGNYSGEEADVLPGSESLRMYVVRTGDTLSNIAARELGSISLADNIFLLNRDVIDDPDRLIAGVKIRLPVRDGSVIPEAGDPGAVVRRPTSGTGRVHTVARGDTLSSIAAEYYGTSSAWRFLYEANRNIVPDPNRLSVGTELTIPPYEETF